MLMFSLNAADFLQNATDRDIGVNICNHLVFQLPASCAERVGTRP